MHSEFPFKKFVKVNARNITWHCIYPYDTYLPLNVLEYDVAIDEDVDPSEKWCTDGISGYEVLCKALYNQLSDEYRFDVIYIDDVEVID
jgi:hypothetical protein